MFALWGGANFPVPLTYTVHPFTSGSFLRNCAVPGILFLLRGLPGEIARRILARPPHPVPLTMGGFV